MRFVLDASVTISWAMLDESNPVADLAFSALRSGTAVAPAIWWYEVRNILRIPIASSSIFRRLTLQLTTIPIARQYWICLGGWADRYTTRPISRWRCANVCRWRPWTRTWRLRPSPQALLSCNRVNRGASHTVHLMRCCFVLRERHRSSCYCPGLRGTISGGATSTHRAVLASDRHSDHSA